MLSLAASSGAVSELESWDHLLRGSLTWVPDPLQGDWEAPVSDQLPPG